MQKRPYFKSYLMFSLFQVAGVLFLLFSLLAYLLIEDKAALFLPISLIAGVLGLFLLVLYLGLSRIERQLRRVNHYLSDSDALENIEERSDFFTHEFDMIHQNLMKVLKKTKKREEKKQRYMAKLKLKNRQRGDMISAIAHEFRNPIASIIGYAQTLEEDKEIPPALQEKFLAKISNNGSKIDALLGRLVLWNKFESGEAKLEPSAFGMKSLIEEVIASIAKRYEHRTIVIEGSDFEVKADRTLIDIVLKNLIENALKYSKDEVSVVLDNGKISVVDKGAGIAEKELSKVTKKFYRSETHNWDNSMGLGLSIVKKILSLHAAKLEIESKETQGSSFSFVLTPVA